LPASERLRGHVVACCNCGGMTLKPLRGIELRYALTVTLADEGPMSVADLHYQLTLHGLQVAGRASKSISDALRWEVRLGRVLPRGRGYYGYGEMPRATEYRMRKRVECLRQAAEASAEEVERAVRGGYDSYY